MKKRCRSNTPTGPRNPLVDVLLREDAVIREQQMQEIVKREKLVKEERKEKKK